MSRDTSMRWARRRRCARHVRPRGVARVPRWLPAHRARRRTAHRGARRLERSQDLGADSSLSAAPRSSSSRTRSARCRSGGALIATAGLAVATPALIRAARFRRSGRGRVDRAGRAHRLGRRARAGRARDDDALTVRGALRTEDVPFAELARFVPVRRPLLGRLGRRLRPPLRRLVSHRPELA